MTNYSHYPSYQEGRNARIEGLRREQNPYDPENYQLARLAWWQGWDDQEAAFEGMASHEISDWLDEEEDPEVYAELDDWDYPDLDECTWPDEN